MVTDSSALVALLLGEPETPGFVAAIAGASSRSVSAGAEAQQKLDQLLSELAIEVVPFTRDQAGLGVAAFRQFGRGTGHPAALNFGDCFSYALAKFRREPVLFKGNDFSRTDVEIAAVRTDPP